ncbi:hypothetical protein, partial [Streptomyces sp. NPDC058953]
GALSRVTVAALTAALVATGTSAVAADNPGGPGNKSATTKTAAAKSDISAEYRTLHGVSGGSLYEYIPDNDGGYGSRRFFEGGWENVVDATQADNDGDGLSDDRWVRDNTGLLMYESREAGGLRIGGGWNIYDKVFSPGNLGGAAGADLLARDKAGALWLYLGYGDGRVAQRAKVGDGWNIYDHIAGLDDVSGDAKDDVVAVDTSGVLWLHQGTGNHEAPFKPRVRVGGGWGVYNDIVGVGDLDSDGINDLAARDKAGALWRYSGTGSATAPYAPRVQIGTGGWNTYRLIF